MKATPRLIVIALVCYLLGGGLVKYCPFPDVWWIANMAQDFGSGLLGFLGVTNMGKMRAVMALLSGQAPPTETAAPAEPINPSPHARPLT